MLPLCHKRVHPNPPVSLTISFTWGFLVECRQRLNILPAEIGTRLSFLSKLPRESEKKKNISLISLWFQVYKSRRCTSGGVLFKWNAQPCVTSTRVGEVWQRLRVLMTTETSQMHRFAGFILSTCELHEPECIQVSSPRHFQTPHGLLNGAKRCSSPSKSSKVNFVLTVEYNLEISHQFFLCLMMLSY